MIDSKVLLQNPLIGKDIKLSMLDVTVTYGMVLVIPEIYENSTVETVEILVSLQDRSLFYVGQEAFIKTADDLWLKFKIEKFLFDPPLYAKIVGEFISWVTV